MVTVTKQQQSTIRNMLLNKHLSFEKDTSIGRLHIAFHDGGIHVSVKSRQNC